MNQVVQGFTLRIGTLQRSALMIYVTDPAHDKPEGLELAQCGLVVTDAHEAWDRILEAINSADHDSTRLTGEAATFARADRDALQRIADRITATLK